MFVSFCNCLAMPALLRQLWPRVVSEAKAALACNELINDAKKRAEALLQLLGAMSADTPPAPEELNKIMDACGRDLVLRVKELAALHEEDVSGEAGSIKNELEGNLKLLREYVQGVGNCAKELDHAVTFLGMCWPDSGGDAKLPVERSAFISQDCCQGWTMRLDLLRSWVAPSC